MTRVSLVPFISLLLFGLVIWNLSALAVTQSLVPDDVENLNQLPDIAAKIGAELRNQYILGYRPSNRSHDARWRKVKIKLRTPKGLPPVSIYAKTGYYAPSL